MGFKKLVSLLLVVIFTISISSFASANDRNMSQGVVSNHILLEQEEVNSALVSAVDSSLTLKSQEISLPVLLMIKRELLTFKLVYLANNKLKRIYMSD